MAGQHQKPETRLVLFDIDGTLLRGIGQHKEAFKDAFVEIFGVDDTAADYHGNTDLNIIHSIIERHALKNDDASVTRIIESMIAAFKKKDLEGIILLPGVQDLLEELERRPGVHIGLVTGNIEDIAYVKLRHFKIDRYFTKGGFGHTSRTRSDLVKEAVSKFEKDLGKIDMEKVFVIGDTPKDVRSAKEAGARAIAVATGSSSVEELQGSKPDFIFKDLTDTESIAEVIMNG